MILIEYIFWLSSFLIVYNYFLYPILIISISKPYKPDDTLQHKDESQLPKISFIIAAYNEETVIFDKLNNTLDIEYPESKIEIIVVSDGSNDTTVDIVNKFKEKRVISLHESARNGKSAALNRGASKATGEILIFSDANNYFNKNACLELVKHFDNELIGGVTGLKRIIEDDSRDSSDGDSLYWRYESSIKQAESDIKTITNADGEIFAIRKSLYEDIPPHVINDDADLTFSLRRQGYLIKYDQTAIASEKASINIKDDYFVKVRMVAGAYQTLSIHWRELFSPIDLFSFMFISHKVLRWLVPHFMILALISNLFLLGESIYNLTFILQVLFYVLSASSLLYKNKAQIPTLIYIPYYFCYMNIAGFHGFLRFINNNQSTSWRRAER